LPVRVSSTQNHWVLSSILAIQELIDTANFVDIIKDITTNFPKMNGLPKTVYENMYHRAYQHIARRLVVCRTTYNSL
jgi:hypothetical protein